MLLLGLPDLHQVPKVIQPLMEPAGKQHAEQELAHAAPEYFRGIYVYHFFHRAIQVLMDIRLPHQRIDGLIIGPPDLQAGIPEAAYAGAGRSITSREQIAEFALRKNLVVNHGKNASRLAPFVNIKYAGMAASAGA